MKTREVEKFGVRVIISYDPEKTDSDQLKELIQDAEITCVRVKNKRGY